MSGGGGDPQECEGKAYDRFLAPGLEFDGFKGIYLNKAGQAQVWEAWEQVVFDRKSRGTVFFIGVARNDQWNDVSLWRGKNARIRS